MQNVFQVLTVVVVLGTIQNPACGKALQFNADGFVATEDTATWNAGWASNAMTSVHAATNGWSFAVKQGDTVFFDNGVSSPLGFPDSATNSVSYAFAVVKCIEASDHATLIDAPCSIRFIPDVSYTKDGATTNQAVSQALAPFIQNSEDVVFSETASVAFETLPLPSWWNDDSTDTDGDGIPDLWEKWTHGNRAVADGDIDRDG